MSYDNWKTRTPEDAAAFGRKPKVQPRVSAWRTCPAHGWTEHRGYPGYEMACAACEKDARIVRAAEAAGVTR